MIVDASAIVAILAREPEADDIMNRLFSAAMRQTHPISVYEAAVAMARLNDISIEVASRDVRDFVTQVELRVVPIHADTARAALEAFASFGRGRHPARLNMGDCFSYAVAKTRGMPLLYKGDDFAQTDLA